MAIYDFFLSRNGAASTPENYVGHAGRLFYDSDTGVIKISDGITPGGTSIPITLATETVAGAIKLGPGIALNGQGQIIIDSEGLDFNFGDFEAITGEYTDETTYALLSSANVDEDIVIASNGDGAVKVVGQFDIYQTNGTVTGSLEEYEPFFRVKDDGQVRILVPLADTTEGGVEIIGSALGTALDPGIAGTMLHLTGNAGLNTRVYHDTLGEYSSYVFRRYNGSVVTPTAVLANQDIGRLNWTAATSSGMGNMSLAQIRVTALENQTATAQGSKITFTVTPIGSAASSRVDVATITTADGVSATKFTGPLVGNVTGTVSGNAGTATTLATARNINGVSFNGSADITVTAAAGTLTGTTLASNVVTSSLTSVGTLGSLTVTNQVAAQNYKGNTRNAGTLTAGSTLTIDYTTDHIVLVNITGAITIAHQNIAAGRNVKVVIVNATGGNLAVTTGVADINTTGNNASANLNATRMGVYEFISLSLIHI